MNPVRSKACGQPVSGTPQKAQQRLKPVNFAAPSDAKPDTTMRLQRAPSADCEGRTVRLPSAGQVNCGNGRSAKKRGTSRSCVPVRESGSVLSDGEQMAAATTDCDRATKRRPESSCPNTPSPRAAQRSRDHQPMRRGFSLASPSLVEAITGSGSLAGSSAGLISGSVSGALFEAS